jgi:hypothetical protein
MEILQVPLVREGKIERGKGRDKMISFGNSPNPVYLVVRYECFLTLMTP